jgi:hypothetical protein
MFELTPKFPQSEQLPYPRRIQAQERIEEVSPY